MKPFIKTAFYYIPFICLCSCGSTQGVRTTTTISKETGQPVIVKTHFQNTGILNQFEELDQSLEDVPNGIKLVQRVRKGDNKAVVDSWFAGKSLLEGVRGLWRNADIKTAGDAASQLKGTVDPQAIPGAALGEAHVLGTVPGSLKVIP